MKNIFDIDGEENWKESPPRVRRLIMAVLVLTSIAIPLLVVFLRIDVSTGFAAMYASLITLSSIAVGFYFNNRGKQDNTIVTEMASNFIQDKCNADSMLEGEQIQTIEKQ